MAGTAPGCARRCGVFRGERLHSRCSATGVCAAHPTRSASAPSLDRWHWRGRTRQRLRPVDRAALGWAGGDGHAGSGVAGELVACSPHATQRGPSGGQGAGLAAPTAADPHDQGDHGSLPCRRARLSAVRPGSPSARLMRPRPPSEGVSATLVPLHRASAKDAERRVATRGSVVPPETQFGSLQR